MSTVFTPTIVSPVSSPAIPQGFTSYKVNTGAGMSNGLTTRSAQREYFSRPSDQRFYGLQPDGSCDLLEVMRAEEMRSAEVERPAAFLKFLPLQDGGIGLSTGPDKAPRSLSYHAFNQSCELAGAPAGHYRKLSPETATLALNELWAQRAQEQENVRILARANDEERKDWTLRSLNSQGYGRLWSHRGIRTVLEAAQGLGLRTPPAWAFDKADPRNRIATAADCGDFTLVRPGDEIGPAGAYYSPFTGRDTFLYLISPQSLKLPGGEVGFRFMLLSNSEVGAGAFSILTGVMARTCGNHMILSPQQVKKVRVIHKGAEVLDRLQRDMHRAIGVLQSAPWEEEIFAKSAERMLGDTRDEVMAKAATVAKLPLSTVKAAMDLDPVADYGSQRSAYYVGSMLTQYSQTLPYAESKAEVDAAAGVLFALGK